MHWTELGSSMQMSTEECSSSCSQKRSSNRNYIIQCFKSYFHFSALYKVIIEVDIENYY